MVLRFILVFFIFSCLTAAPAPAQNISGSGCSVSNFGYLSELAKEYERRTGVNVLMRGGGTVVGIEDLRAGTVDFAAACRGPHKHDPENIDFVQVAWDALVFIVHNSNSVENISLDAVRKIYSGAITNWKQLGGKDLPIKIFLSKPGKGLSGIDSALIELVLQGKQPARSLRVLSLASTGIVEQIVEKTPAGFAAAGYSSARRRNVRMLGVNGLYPSYRNIVNKTYTFTRPLFLIVPKKPKPEVKRFLEFVLGKEGQEFIASQHVVPLKHLR